MDARAFLERPHQLKELVDTTVDEVIVLQSMAEQVRAQLGREHEPVKHTPDVYAMQDIVIRLAEAREREAQLRREYAEAIAEVGLMLVKIQDTKVRDFMTKKFLEFMSLSEIGLIKSYGRTWCQNTCRKGIAMVQEMLDADEEKTSECGGKKEP